MLCKSAFYISYHPFIEIKSVLLSKRRFCGLARQSFDYLGGRRVSLRHHRLGGLEENVLGRSLDLGAAHAPARRRRHLNSVEAGAGLAAGGGRRPLWAGKGLAARLRQFVLGQGDEPVGAGGG